MPPPVRVTLIGRDGCHLCEVARATVERVTADPELLERWSDQVPVTLVDGRQHDYWRVDEARLRAALASPPAEASPGL